MYVLYVLLIDHIYILFRGRYTNMNHIQNISPYLIGHVPLMYHVNIFNGQLQIAMLRLMFMAPQCAQKACKCGQLFYAG